MASEWIILNSIAERDEGADLLTPWYPCLFVDGGLSVSFEIWFATYEECHQFIKAHVLGATLEEEQ